MHLFFDTETSGLPRNYKAPASDLDNWPRLVELAWLCVDADGNELFAHSHIVKPEGFTIPAEASKIHGITTERALAEGLELKAVLGTLLLDLTNITALVAHNMAFDEKILGAELLRSGHTNLIDTLPKQCTMLLSTEYCRLRNTRGGFKWPKLQELHKRLFGTEFEGAHGALADVRACAKCYFELCKRNIILPVAPPPDTSVVT